jgi:phosphoinositide-3-kinase, regulatory subunit 4
MGYFLVWIIYQMVFSVYTIHEVFNIYHGNIRTSNFLLNNYMYLYLTDFASYKPTYIMQDTEQGLREFRLFYASSV